MHISSWVVDPCSCVDGGAKLQLVIFIAQHLSGDAGNQNHNLLFSSFSDGPVSAQESKIKTFNFHPAAWVMREPDKYLRPTPKETTMITFKQFLQNKAANKRAELADVEAQAKRAEADVQRKKAATATRPMTKSSKWNQTVPF